MCFSEMKRALAVAAALVALPLMACAEKKGSCLESSRALLHARSTYIWCPDGWKASRQGDTTTFKCDATHTARSYKEGMKGGEQLTLVTNKDTPESCR